MIEQVLDLVRGLVRPVVLVGMVSTALYLWVQGDAEAAAAVATFAGAPMGFWFSDRVKRSG